MSARNPTLFAIANTPGWYSNEPGADIEQRARSQVLVNYLDYLRSGSTAWFWDGYRFEKTSHRWADQNRAMAYSAAWIVTGRSRQTRAEQLEYIARVSGPARAGTQPA